MKNYLTLNNGKNYSNDIFGLFDSIFEPYFENNTKDMKTDVISNENDYVLNVEIPGFDKKDISLKFEKGYLTISAEKCEDEKDKKNYVKRERCLSLSRSYYVGDVDRENIKAKYENGVLSVNIPKEVNQNKVNTIEIE